MIFHIRITDFKRHIPRGERLLKNFLNRALPISWGDVLRQDPCAYCGGRGGTVDHIIARHKKGKDTVDNLTAACNTCNLRKGTRQLLRFLIAEHSKGRR